MPAIKASIPTPTLGVRVDLAANQVPQNALVSSLNMIYRRGRFQPRYGVARFSATDNVPNARGVISYLHTDNAWRLVVINDAGWQKYVSATDDWTDISTSALSACTHAVMRVFQKDGKTWLIGINNGVDVPYVWDGLTGTNAVMGGTPPKARCMMVLGHRVFLANLTTAGAGAPVSPVAYDVSEFDDFDTGWGAVQFGLLNDTPGHIVGCMELGNNQGAIYKSDCVVVATLTANTQPFAFEYRDIAQYTGPCNQRSICSMPDGSHLYLGRNGALMRFDGVDAKSMGYHIQKWLDYDSYLDTLFQYAHMYFDSDRNEARIFYLSKSAGTREIVVSMDNASIWPMRYEGEFQLINAAGYVRVPGASSANAYENLIFTDNYDYLESGTLEDDGSPIGVSWEFGLQDLGAPGYWKTVNTIDHLFRYGVDDPRHQQAAGSQAVSVMLRYSDGGSDSADAETSAQTLTISDDAANSYVTDHRATGKLIGLEYSAAALDKLFEYRGAVASVALRGPR